MVDNQHWLDRWKENRIGFHENTVNRHLKNHLAQFDLPAAASVFLPLCGKARDIAWLAQQGYQVFGIELSQLAIEAFFAENSLEFECCDTDRFAVYKSAGISLLVDWESWVGYSERSWASFLAERPREPTLFRVLSRQIPYYNGAFRDESEWKSFRFRSADEEHYVYAYAREGSAAARALFPPERREKDAAFVVRIRFPDSPDGAGAEGDRAIAQVVVEEVVCSGWVREGGTTAVR